LGSADYFYVLEARECIADRWHLPILPKMPLD
jgi:hypothetical protein